MTSWSNRSDASFVSGASACFSCSIWMFSSFTAESFLSCSTLRDSAIRHCSIVLMRPDKQFILCNVTTTRRNVIVLIPIEIQVELSVRKIIICSIDFPFPQAHFGLSGTHVPKTRPASFIIEEIRFFEKRSGIWFHRNFRQSSFPCRQFLTDLSAFFIPVTFSETPLSILIFIFQFTSLFLTFSHMGIINREVYILQERDCFLWKRL